MQNMSAKSKVILKPVNFHGIIFLIEIRQNYFIFHMKQNDDFVSWPFERFSSENFPELFFTFSAHQPQSLHLPGMGLPR